MAHLGVLKRFHACHPLIQLKPLQNFISTLHLPYVIATHFSNVFDRKTCYVQ